MTGARRTDARPHHVAAEVPARPSLRAADDVACTLVRAAAVIVVVACAAPALAACDAPSAPRTGQGTVDAGAPRTAASVGGDGGRAASSTNAVMPDGGVAAAVGLDAGRAPAAPARPWTAAAAAKVCALATKISLGGAGPEIGAHVPLTLRLHFDGCAAKDDVDAGPCTTTVQGREVTVAGAAAVRARDGVDAGPCEPVFVTCKGPVATPGTWTIRAGAARVAVKVPGKVPAGGSCSK